MSRSSNSSSPNAKAQPSFVDNFANIKVVGVGGGGQNAVNVAYILYLRGRAEGLPAADIERLVRRWYVMSALRGRSVGNAEGTIDFDIRQIHDRGLVRYTTAVIDAELSDSYWSTLRPQAMETSSSGSP